MTAAGLPVRSRPPRAVRRWPAAAGRLLRLELRRNAMPWLVPLLAAVFLVVTCKAVLGYQPLWDLRAMMMVSHLLTDLVPFAAGAAAWMGARDGRSHITDLVAVTSRPGWARQGATLAATACWVLAVYLACVAVLYGVTAAQATWGGPPWWPVAVGAVAVTAVCALGFAAGVFFPSRFTAPLAAVGVLLVTLVGMRYAVNSSGGVALLSPVTGVPPFDVGVFYPYLPDLAIAQVMFLAGLAIAALGAVGLPAAAGGRRLRLVAALVTAAGLAAAGTAAGLAGTARPGAYGVVIPALHDAASDRPIPYAPVCHRSAVPVCVHPAFRRYLADVAAALDPAISQVAGLPGTPARAAQAATTYGMRNGSQQVAVLTGTPPVLRLYLANIAPGTLAPGARGFDQLRLAFLHAFVGAGPGPGTQAQQAVQAALLQRAGMPLAAQPQVLSQAPWAGPGPTAPARGPVYAAASRLAGLPAATRRAWLAAHLAALRSGRLTLAALP